MTNTIQFTLAQLQSRRSDAMYSGDRLAEAAYDLLIGHVLGEAEMYARTNAVLAPDWHDDFLNKVVA